MTAASRASPTDNDSGMVTIEAAIALCAFISVLALVLAGMSTVFDQLRCTDAAREAARLVARGEQDRATDAVLRIAPPGATYSVTASGDGIIVAVRDPDSLLPGVDVHADAYAVPEPGDEGSSRSTGGDER
jgi:Flp pilus assembly protein TadG